MGEEGRLGENMKKKKSSLLNEHKEFIIFLSKLSPLKRSKLIDLLTRGHLDCIAEICKNFLRKNLTDDLKTVRRLKKYEGEIRAISRKNTPIRKKKHILSSKRGGSILSLLLPLASGLISSLIL